jgi:predicted nucleotidyltransferase
LLEQLCEIYAKFNLKLIVLFGFYNKGDYTNESDVDILIVSDAFPHDPREALVWLIAQNFLKLCL